jgi:hypothetical protein
MPRLNTGDEVMKELTSGTGLQIARQLVTSPFSQAITAPLARGAATATVAATTNATLADPVFISGDGGTELNALGTPNVTMPLKYKAEFAQSTGAMIREATIAALGHISPETGITFRGARDLVPIISALARAPIKYVQAGVADLSVSFDLILWNNSNLAFLFGQDESLELGTGVMASDPYQIGVGLASIGNYTGLQAIRANGTFVDGRQYMVDFCDAVVRVNGEVRLGGRPDQFRVPVTLGFTNLVQRIGA